MKGGDSNDLVNNFISIAMVECCISGYCIGNANSCCVMPSIAMAWWSAVLYCYGEVMLRNVMVGRCLVKSW